MIEISRNYLLLKMRLSINNPIIIIQNQGLDSSSLMGSYPISPKALSRISSSQEYESRNNFFRFSAVKKFFISSIMISEFYLLSVYL